MRGICNKRIKISFVEGYVNRSHEVNGLVIQYEDLCSGQFPIEKLEDYLDVEISRNILEQKVDQTKKKESITKIEVSLLKRAINPFLNYFSYKMLPTLKVFADHCLRY